MDDPLRVIRAFQHPSELTFVDLNTQVTLRVYYQAEAFLVTPDGEKS